VADNVYIQSNEAEGNRVLAFRRDPDGTLTHRGSFSTGGAGTGAPHLPSQGSVVLTGDGRHLLVTNAGSGDLSVFATGDDALTLLQPIPSGGGAPRSVTEHDGLVYVLNTQGPSLSGFRIHDGSLEPVNSAERNHHGTRSRRRYDGAVVSADGTRIGYRPMVACSPFTEPSGSGRSGGWPPTSRCCCGVALMMPPYGAHSPRCSR
jgi:6-phosphogluconolactonase (cycloisomerase 2 family)